MTIQPFERVSQADSKLNFVVYYKHFLLHLRKLHIFCGEQSIIIWRDSQSSQHCEVFRSWLPGYVSSGAMESNLSGSGKSITAKVSRHLCKVRVSSAIIKPTSFRVLFHSWNKSLSFFFFSSALFDQCISKYAWWWWVKRSCEIYVSWVRDSEDI